MGMREAKKEQTRSALLEAARSLFAERGYQGTTTAEIAARCGLAEGTLFNYFRSKGDLFAAALIPQERTEDAARQLPAVADPRLRSVTAVISGYIADKLQIAAHTPKPLLRELMGVLYGSARPDSDAAREQLLAIDLAMAEEIRDYLASCADRLPASERFDASLAADCIYQCVLSGLFLYVLDDSMTFDGWLKRVDAQIAFILSGHLPE